MKPTNLKVSKYVKDNLDKIDGGTYDSKLNNLIDIVESVMPFVEYNDERKNMKISPKTLERLDSFRITSTESRDNILTRMLIMLDELNNTDNVEEWIPFKLTNPYNEMLIIEGQYEFNSKVISYNYRGNVFFEKLPKSYIVEGKDLTKSLYKWYDIIDWDYIKQLLVENVDVPIVIDEKDYLLEINTI